MKDTNTGMRDRTTKKIQLHVAYSVILKLTMYYFKQSSFMQITHDITLEKRQIWDQALKDSQFSLL